MERHAEAEKLAKEHIEADSISPLEKADYLCVLGDIYNDEEYYNKAWRISKGRHGRSMRSLGTLLVHKKRHREAAEAFSKG